MTVVISQLERLNSNETTIAPRSAWIAVNGSDLSAPTFMVSSKMDGGDPHFDVGSIATHNMSWDLESNRGRLIRLGEMSEDYAQPLHRGTGGSMHTRKAHATREAPMRDQG